MRNKKLLAAMLAAVMVTGSLAGCGGQESGTSGESSGGTTGGSAQGSEVSQSSESGGGGSESAGELKTIKILGVDRGITDSNGTIVHLSDWVKGDSKMYDKLTEDLAERGLKLELDLIPADQYATTLQNSLTTGLDCDLVNITPLDASVREQLIKKGTLIAVNELREQYSAPETVAFYTTGEGHEVAKLNVMEDGNEYWVSGITIGEYNGESWGGFVDPMIRYDWLKKLNLEVPKTTEELFNVLKKFKDEDANGDGMNNEVAIVGVEGFYNGVAQLFGLGTDVVYIDYETGKATSPWYEDSIKDYISYMKRLYDAELLDMSGQAATLEAENKVSMTFGWWVETWTEPTITVKEGDAAPYYIGILCDAENGTKPLITRQNGIQKANWDFAVTDKADKEAMGKLFDYLISEDFYVLAGFGIEGYTYENKDGVLVKYPANDIQEVQIMSMGAALWVGDSIFPRYEVKNRVQELISCEEGGYTAGYPETGYKEKAQVLRDVYENPDNYSYAMMDVTSNVAVATSEERERTAEIQTDLNTYYQELLSNLVMGKKSMDDWDSYISEMKKLGLDDLISIRQAQYDRANK